MGPQKGLPVLIEFVGGPVVVALHGGFFAGAVQALDPALGPGVGQLGEAVRHAVRAAGAGKAVPTRQKLLGWGVNCTPLSVKTVWSRQGSLPSTRRRNSAATTRLARGWSPAKAALLVRSMATKRYC